MACRRARQKSQNPSRAEDYGLSASIILKTIVCPDSGIRPQLAAATRCDDHSVQAGCFDILSLPRGSAPSGIASIGTTTAPRPNPRSYAGHRAASTRKNACHALDTGARPPSATQHRSCSIGAPRTCRWRLPLRPSPARASASEWLGSSHSRADLNLACGDTVNAGPNSDTSAG